MALTHEPRPDDQELVQYVLGQLPAAQLERVEEASFADEEAAARLTRVENDLVDSYVRGTLSGERLERFESYYLSSPRRAAQVRFAAGFVRTVDRAPASADRGRVDAGRPGELVAIPAADRKSDVPADPHGTNRARRWNLPWRFAAIAAACVLVASGALLIERVRRVDRVEVQPGKSAASEQRVRERAAPPRLPDAGMQPGRVAPPEPPAIAMVLVPQMRAIDPVPAVVIPPGTERVAFELRLDAIEHSRYQVQLRDPASGRIVWRSAWVTASSSADRAAVPVAVPAKLLKPQHYSFELTGRSAAGAPEIVGSYTINILPR